MSDFAKLKLEYNRLHQKYSALKNKYKLVQRRSALRRMAMGRYRTMQVEEMELFLSKSYKYEALGEFVFVYNCELSSSGPSQGCKGQSQVKSSSEMDLLSCVFAAKNTRIPNACLNPICTRSI